MSPSKTSNNSEGSGDDWHSIFVCEHIQVIGMVNASSQMTFPTLRAPVRKKYVGLGISTACMS